MQILGDDIGLLIFKAIPRDEAEELLLDGRSLKVLLELDGKKTLIEVAKRLNLSLAELRTIVQKLLNLGLIELSAESIAKVEEDFFEFLQTQLALAVGPLAQIILEDALSELNVKIEDFPVTYLAELIDILSKEIPREEKKAAFMRSILNKMKEKGY